MKKIISLILLVIFAMCLLSCNNVNNNENTNPKTTEKIGENENKGNEEVKNNETKNNETEKNEIETNETTKEKNDEKDIFPEENKLTEQEINTINNLYLITSSGSCTFGREYSFANNLSLYKEKKKNIYLIDYEASFERYLCGYIPIEIYTKMSEESLFDPMHCGGSDVLNRYKKYLNKLDINGFGTDDIIWTSYMSMDDIKFVYDDKYVAQLILVESKVKIITDLYGNEINQEVLDLSPIAYRVKDNNFRILGAINILDSSKYMVNTKYYESFENVPFLDIVDASTAYPLPAYLAKADEDNNFMLPITEQYGSEPTDLVEYIFKEHADKFRECIVKTEDISRNVNGKDVFFKRIGYFNFEKYRNVIISLIQ